jgi:hypothetical protein
MNARALAKEKARVEGLIKRWQTVMGLGYWRIDRTYWQRAVDFHAWDGGQADDRIVLITCPEWRYMQCTIHVNCEATAQLDDWALEQDVVHELAHCHIDELRGLFGEITEDVRDHIEHVTEAVAKALVWARYEIDGASRAATPDVAVRAENSGDELP